MVLDESALEAMLARGRAAEAEHTKADAVRTEQTDEFEVYERETLAEPAPEPMPAAEPEGHDDFEVYERPEAAPEPMPAPDATHSDFEVIEREPAQAATDPAPIDEPHHATDPVPAQPVPLAEPQAPETLEDAEPAPFRPTAREGKRRPQVWPPIGRAAEAPPAAQATADAGRPPAPDDAPADDAEHPPHISDSGHAGYEDPVEHRTHAPTPHAFAKLEVDGSGRRIAIVQALFNQELTNQMVDSAKQRIEQSGATVAQHITVPGVYDLPLPVQTLARSKRIDGVVVIGVVVQGETKHDELITFSTAKTLQEISLATETPIGLGIIGPGMTWEQAEARVGNGAHAVDAVLALLQH